VIGQTVGTYRILEFLGHGDSGSVYRAEDLVRHRLVALKILGADYGADADGARRLAEALEAVRGIEHAVLPRLWDHGTSDQFRYVAMQLVEGDALENRLRQGPLPAPRAVEVAWDLAGGLGAAHAVGLLHRDLKPAHVLLSASGARLLGLGMTPAGPRLAPLDLRRGVPSPEELADAPTDARSDLFRLGALLYEMVTGGRPFSGDSAASLRRAILDGPPEPPSRGREGVPQSLDRAVLRALAADPDERPATAAEFQRDLSGAGIDLNAQNLTRAPLARRRRRHFGTLVPTLATIAILVLVWLLWRAVRSQM
jgi:serine/threonine protein kinase